MNKINNILLNWITENTIFNTYKKEENEFGIKYQLYSDVYKTNIQIEYISDTNVYYVDHEKYEGLKALKKCLKEY